MHIKLEKKTRSRRDYTILAVKKSEDLLIYIYIGKMKLESINHTIDD